MRDMRCISTPCSPSRPKILLRSEKDERRREYRRMGPGHGPNDEQIDVCTLPGRGFTMKHAHTSHLTPYMTQRHLTFQTSILPPHVILFPPHTSHLTPHLFHHATYLHCIIPHPSKLAAYTSFPHLSHLSPYLSPHTPD